MEDNVQLKDYLNPSMITRSDIDDDIENDQQQQQQQLSPSLSNQQRQPLSPLSPLLLNQQSSNVSVSSLLDLETDHEAIESLELLLKGVVKIFRTLIPYNFDSPWQVKSQSNSTASGFIIKNRWILSNAHAVSNQSIIRIRKHGDPKKYPGRVVHIAHECDLVIMTVDDDKFWDNVDPLTFSNRVPRLQESITVVGYPTGGDDLSVTKGVVSRVSISAYSHSLENLLEIQVDAAINSGNSGGPAIQGKQVVGIPFESFTDAQSIGCIIPVSVIKHVLLDIKLHKSYTAFPRMAFRYQLMENASYRKYLKLNDDQHGILVTSVEPACVLSKILQKDDVIIALDGKAIADDGTIDFRRGERLNFRYLEKQKFVCDTVTFTVIRQGKEITLTSSLDNNPALVPFHSHDKRPEYLIYAGIVFTVLTRFYLHKWGRYEWHEEAPAQLVNLAKNGQLQELNQQIVVISRIIVDNVNYGVDSGVVNSVLETVNGIKIKNIKHLAELLDEISNNEDDGYIQFETEPKHFIVISCNEAKQSETRILEQNSIAQARSQNLR